MTVPELPDVATAADVGEYLQVPESTVVALARANKIGTVKIGRHLRFPRAEVEAYVREHTLPAKENPWGLTDGAAWNIEKGRSGSDRG